MTRRTRELLFTAGVAVYLIVLYLGGTSLAPATKAFPLAIVVFTALVAVAKVLAYAFPQLAFLDPGGETRKKTEANADEDSDGKADVPAASQRDKAGSRLAREVLSLIWLASFPLGIYLFGFLPTLFVWLMTFMVGLSRIKIAQAVVLSVSAWVILYGMFGLLLKVNFSGGILF